MNFQVSQLYDPHLRTRRRSVELVPPTQFKANLGRPKFCSAQKTIQAVNRGEKKYWKTVKFKFKWTDSLSKAIYLIIWQSWAMVSFRGPLQSIPVQGLSPCGILYVWYWYMPCDCSVSVMLSQSAPVKQSQGRKPTNLCTPHEFRQKCILHVW